jgi:regulatory protein
VRAAYLAALRQLSARELSEKRVRERLLKRQHAPDAIEKAIERLRSEGAIDDRRAAIACARTEAAVKGHGRERVLRRLQAIGIPNDLARQATDQVFETVDEPALLLRALARRKRHGETVRSPGGFRRLYQALVRQGFEPSAVVALLRSQGAGAGEDEES